MTARNCAQLCDREALCQAETALTRVTGKPAQTLRPYWKTTMKGAKSSSSHKLPPSPSALPAAMFSFSRPLMTTWLSSSVALSGLGSSGACSTCRQRAVCQQDIQCIGMLESPEYSCACMTERLSSWVAYLDWELCSSANLS